MLDRIIKSIKFAFKDSQIKYSEDLNNSTQYLREKYAIENLILLSQ